MKYTQFSPCRLYRYTLWREWDMANTSYLMVIGLNPSTADESKDDPTIRKCIGFAKRWGFGALCMTNLFAWRDTDPAKMKKVPNPVGIDNHHHVLQCAADAGMVLAAWGVHGKHQNQDLNVRQWVASAGKMLHCLRPTKDGSPGHLLYIPYEEKPQIYSPTPPAENKEGKE